MAALTTWIYVSQVQLLLCVLDLHLARHEQGANLHVRRRLLLAHLFNRGRPVLFEIGSEREQEILVERSARSLIRAAFSWRRE